MSGNLFKSVFLLLMVSFIFTGAASYASEKDELKKSIRAILKENPDILLDVLKENDMEFFDIVQNAAMKKQQMARKAQRNHELKNPLKPVIEKTRPIRGNPKARVTIVEYSDFQCPFCGRGAKTVEALLKKYKGDVRLIYKHMPLTNIHPHAMKAAIYFEAIARQDAEKAWKFHDIIFDNQNKLKGGEKAIKKIAASLGLNEKRLQKDVKDKAILAQVEKDSKEAMKFGFTGTPSFVVNGISLKGAQPIESFSRIIDKALKK